MICVYIGMENISQIHKATELRTEREGEWRTKIKEDTMTGYKIMKHTVRSVEFSGIFQWFQLSIISHIPFKGALKY